MTAPAVSGRPPWWAGITSSAMALDCGGLIHRLEWAEGQLSAPDHAQADRERALVALGGDRVACLDLLDAWNAHTDDLDLLVLASRGPSDRLRELEPGEDLRYSGSYARRSGFSAVSRAARFRPPGRRGGGRSPGPGWTMYMPANSGIEAHNDSGGVSIARLACLGDGLTDRLVATVIATWSERIRDGDDGVVAARPRMQAALYGRVLATIRGLRPQLEPLDLVMVEPQAPRSITVQDTRIRCELPFGWLSEVWAKGMASVLGHLCLNVGTADADRWQLLVAGSDLRGTRTMTIDLSALAAPPPAAPSARP